MELCLVDAPTVLNVVVLHEAFAVVGRQHKERVKESALPCEPLEELAQRSIDRPYFSVVEVHQMLTVTAGDVRIIPPFVEPI